MARNIILLSLMLIFCGNVNSQSLQILKEKNGFKKYKLGSNVSNYPELSNKSNSELFYKYKQGTYTWKKYSSSDVPYIQIGDVYVTEMYFDTFDQKIHRINVFVEGKDSEKVKTILNQAFGTYNATSWEIGNISCKFFVSYGEDTLIQYEDKNLIDEAILYEKKVDSNGAADKI